MKEKKQPEQENTEKPRKKRRILARLLLFILALILLLVGVTAVVFRDHLNMDSIRRWFHYRSLMLNDSGQAESFAYEGDLNDAFATLDGDLLVCSSNTISLYSGSGTRYVNESVSMENPVMESNGTLAVIYDAGGDDLYVLGQRQLVWKADGLSSILAAHLNRSGQLTVVTQADGYRGAVTVYGTDYNPIVTVNLSSAYVMDAALSDDGKTLSILTVGQTDGAFSSTLSLYALNTTDGGDFSPDIICSLDSNVILTTRHTENLVWSLGNLGLDITDHKGKTVSIDWSDRHLKRYTLEGDGYATVLLSRYRAGSNSELVTIGPNGDQHTVEYNEQILSLAAAGRYVAVLTGDRLDLYTSDLTPYATLEGTQGARGVLLMSDGSAILLFSGSASYYVP
jgi:hypothetical protein